MHNYFSLNLGQVRFGAKWRTGIDSRGFGHDHVRYRYVSLGISTLKFGTQH